MRGIKSVLNNFLGTYTSRYSDFGGFWLFGSLVAVTRELNIDLLGPLRDPTSEDSIEVIASRLARQKFRQQMKKSGLDISDLCNAHLNILCTTEVSKCKIDFFTDDVYDGYMVKLGAKVTTHLGREYQDSTEIFVAPHFAGDPNCRCPSCNLEKNLAIRADWENSRENKLVFSEGKKWLVKHPCSSLAGELINRLIHMTPDSEVLEIAQAWVCLYPNDSYTYPLISKLMDIDPSQEIVEIAQERVKSFDNVDNLSLVISAILRSQADAQRFEVIEEALEKHPTCNEWAWAWGSLPSCENSEGSRKLILRWLELNAGNPNLNFSMHGLSDRSPEIAGAAFKWMRTAGRSSERMPNSIPPLIETARVHGQMLSEVLRFAKEWLNENSNRPEAGLIHAAIVRATTSKADIWNAKTWYREHLHDENAWQILAELLSIAYWHSDVPDKFAIEEAQIYLRKADYRDLLLVGNLISVWADEESIAWAKETNNLWVLSRLVSKAPDAESIAAALASIDRWKEWNLEAEMLLALLKAVPENESISWRARVWAKQNKEHRLFSAVNSMLSRKHVDTEK